MPKILVIDIDINVQSDLHAIGEKLGIQFYFTDSIQKAWPILEDMVTIDAVFMDSQIGQDQGWQFANQLQKHICFNPLPIVVFASTIDKESIKKLVQAKVNHILRKPYTLDAVQAQLKRIKENLWHEEVFTDPKLICSNLSIDEKIYFERHITAASEIQQGINDLLFACDRPKSGDFQRTLAQIQQICNELGFPFMSQAMIDLTQVAHELDLEDLVATLNGMKPMVKLMRKRAYKGLGMEDPEAPKTEKEALSKPVHLQRNKPKKRIKPPTSSDTNTKNSFRVITNSSLEEFAPFLDPLFSKPSFTREEIIRQSLRAHSLPFSNELRQDLKILIKSESFDFKQALAYVWKVPLLANRLIELAIAHSQMLAPEDDEVRQTGDLAKLAVNALGFDYVLMNYCILRFFAFTNKLKAPIDMEPVFTRMLARTLTAIHLCQSLKIKQSTLMSFLCIGQNLGTFLLSSIYPFHYAANLIRAKNDPLSYYQGQRDLFQLTEIELAAAYLRYHKFENDPIDIILHCQNPEQASTRDNRLLAAIVNLADNYAREKQWGYDGYLLPEDTPELKSHPSWQIIREFNLNLDKDLNTIILNFENGLHRVERDLHILI